jgi:hypothetical protein
MCNHQNALLLDVVSQALGRNILKTGAQRAYTHIGDDADGAYTHIGDDADGAYTHIGDDADGEFTAHVI